MLTITLLPPSHLSVACPPSKATAALLKEIPGWKFTGSEWRFPLIQIRELKRIFPLAKFSDECKQWFVPCSSVRIAAARALCERMTDVGLSVGKEGEMVSVKMLNGTSLPIPRDGQVWEYQNEIVRLLNDGGDEFTCHRYGQAVPQPIITVQSETDLDSSKYSHGDILIARGEINARKAADRKSEMLARVKAKRFRKSDQLELLPH